MITTRRFLHQTLVTAAALSIGIFGVSSQATAEPIAKQIQGHWAVDKDFLIEQAKAQSGGQEMPPQAIAMMDMMAAKMVFSFKDGKASMLMEEGEGSYEVLEADEATGKFKMKMTDPEGKAETGNAEIKGDTLTLSKGEEKLKFTRISDEDFEKRKNAPQPQIPGLPPGLTPPTE